jgi:AP endonuclease-1
MSSPARPKRAAASRSTIKAESPGSESSALSEEDVKPPKKTPRTSKVKKELAEKADEVDNEAPKGKGKATPKRAKAPKAEDGDDEKPAKKPRVAKASIFPPADLLPSLHPSRKGHPAFKFPKIDGVRNGGIQPSERGDMPMLIGAHTSIAGGPATALLKAGMLGANGLAMFVKSQRQWKAKDYEPEAVERFRDLMKSKDEGGGSYLSHKTMTTNTTGLGYPAESILVHGSYLINLGCVIPLRDYSLD